ncbi:YgjV family protein [Vreelandella utahensis]|uniref:YgjV family protein n=1 Tax=Vreelandella halophila TaxID=86177 RepID=UPI000986F0BD|nr:YgjV family protein [Halomonas utahensis]
MLADMTAMEIAGQIVALISLGFCIAGFASTRDDRLMVLLIGANVAFATQYALFQSWTAAVLTVLVILRIHLARRYQGNVAVMLGMLAISAVAAVLTWQSWIDLFPMTAMLLGTLGMFMLRGIPMRLLLAGAGLAWMGNNIAIGSVGATLAEAMVVATNFVTILRLKRMRRRYPDVELP